MCVPFFRRLDAITRPILSDRFMALLETKGKDVT
jgi:hypothetical protein